MALLLPPDLSGTDGVAVWLPADRPSYEDQRRSNRRMPVDSYLQVLYVVRFVLESTRLQILYVLSLRKKLAVTVGRDDIPASNGAWQDPSPKAGALLRLLCLESTNKKEQIEPDNKHNLLPWASGRKLQG